MILSFIENLGLLGIFFVVFAESGLFFCFFFPGGSLLFSAGVLASAGYFNIFYLFFGSVLFAILGDSVGYWTGKKMGPRIFSKRNSFFFNKNNLDKTAKFYDKYGKRTIVFARFVPIVRTFAPIMAGAGNMKYNSFIFYNIFGAFLWISSMIFSGYFLGNSVNNINQYILPIILFIIVLSLIPIICEFLKKKK
ncbi:MAG: VTT domain-containing protein [Candidatus Pacebacteria bacterium]|nr:VTT domain-containing protein [Candidatus Paceibacterota bacterium]